jgi:PilZ domain
MLQGQMAVDVMRSTFDQRRSSLRVQMAIPAGITCPDKSEPPHTALVRDVSFSGAFVYSDFAPEVASNIVIDFVFPVVERRMRVTCRGVVVRVEKSAKGGATGIAMLFHKHEATVIH